MKLRLNFWLMIFATSFALIAESADYPMFTAYPGASLTKEMVIDYEKVLLPVSSFPAKGGDVTSLQLMGDLYKHKYRVRGVSTLKVFENYRDAAVRAGFKEIFSCMDQLCGDWRAFGRVGDMLSAEPVYAFARMPHYWVGEKNSSKGKIYVAWYIGSDGASVDVHQMIVETEPAENNLIRVNANYSNAMPQDKPVAELSSFEKAKDHPLLPRYPGAEVRKFTKSDTETFRFPVSANYKGEALGSMTGDLMRHDYFVPNVSTLKIYENYKAALTKAGFTLVDQCELDSCGNQAQVGVLSSAMALDGAAYVHQRKPYYLLAKKLLGNANSFVGLFIGGFESSVHVHQVVLSEKAVVTGLVTVNADQLKQQLDEDGKALIYGIYFDTGKATIKPESKPTLDAIAELLKRNPSLLLYVVGHTDDTGSLAINLDLSKQRAKSVKDAMVLNYQIAASRLQAEGVGPYAPTSNNTSEIGKQKNRRVELVKRLQ